MSEKQESVESTKNMTAVDKVSAILARDIQAISDGLENTTSNRI